MSDKTITLTFNLTDVWEEWTFAVPENWDRDDILSAAQDGTIWDCSIGLDESGNASMELDAIDGDSI